MFFRQRAGTVLKLPCGYLGKSCMLPAGGGFALGLAGWFCIGDVSFIGEAGYMPSTGWNVDSIAATTVFFLMESMAIGYQWFLNCRSAAAAQRRHFAKYIWSPHGSVIPLFHCIGPWW